MTFSKSKWIQSHLGTPIRSYLPIMAAPGIPLAGLKTDDVYRSGKLAAICVQALAKRFPLEFSTLFMDLSVEAEAFGAPVAFVPGEIPNINGHIVEDEESIDALEIPSVGTARTSEMLDCAKLCVDSLDRPVLCGMIGPYSLAGRLADMTELMMMTLTEPETAHKLLNKATDFLVEYAKAFKATGAAGILLAEPMAGLISPDMCAEFSSAYIRRIVEAVSDDSFFIILHNCGRTEKQVDAMLASGADALHVGNAVDIREILRQTPSTVPVMGNLDPVAILKDAKPEQVMSTTLELLEATRLFPNFVLSSGCDMAEAVPLANIDALYKALEEYNRA